MVNYPSSLKRGDKIRVDMMRFTVHSVDAWNDERGGIFHNRVGVETTTGVYLLLPLCAPVETV